MSSVGRTLERMFPGLSHNFPKSFATHIRPSSKYLSWIVKRLTITLLKNSRLTILAFAITFPHHFFSSSPYLPVCLLHWAFQVAWHSWYFFETVPYIGTPPLTTANHPHMIFPFFEKSWNRVIFLLGDCRVTLNIVRRHWRECIVSPKLHTRMPGYYPAFVYSAIIP